MKGFIVLFFTTIVISNVIYAQKVEKNPISGGDPYDFRTEKVSEFTQKQHDDMLNSIIRTTDSLVAAGVIPAADPDAEVEYQFPLHSVVDAEGYFRTGSFPYHSGGHDYNGGTRTYSKSGYQHAGTDFHLWPFSWHKMNNDEVEVLAAAPGYVVGKKSGRNDHACEGLNSTNYNWNYVWIRHDDDTYAWYTHLRAHGITTKSGSQRVEAGEVIGLVGSSGASEEPHLHFEVSTRQDNSGAGGGAFDPNIGTNNTSPRNTWVPGVQVPYYDSAINQLMTHSPPGPVWNNCNPATINEKNEFDPGETVGIAAYYRDQLKGQVSEYTVYTPFNTVFESWTHTIPEDFPNSNTYLRNSWWSRSYWYWEIDLPENALGGYWRVEVEYQGKTYEHTFEVSGDITLPVFISSFELKQEDNGVLIEWNTESEVNNQGFIIKRKTKDELQYTEIANCKINQELTGKGNYSGTSAYRYKDCKTSPGQYYQYQLQSVAYSGEIESVATAEIQVYETFVTTIPQNLQLYQNYPNPFNGYTVIPYYLPEEMTVSISIFNLLGQKVVTLINSRENEGNHKITWNTSDAKLNSGTFFIVLKTTKATLSKRIVLIN